MREKRICMIGAGSGFVITVATELAKSDPLADYTFVLMDTDAERLRAAEKVVGKIFREEKSGVELEATTSLEKALDGCRHVVAACEQNRWPFWVKDIEIPEKHGVYQLMGENGGPGGIIHAMRNISMFKNILSNMEEYCPDAWLMNFTNPMSFLCTYFKNYSNIKALGFCHQVHGSLGVIAEQLGMEPGELEVISGGVNHLNWLIDIRRRGTGKSMMDEFRKMVLESKYWREKAEKIPSQVFTLEVFKTFGTYPIGYDDHILEYMPFFYEKEEWERLNFAATTPQWRKLAEKAGSHSLNIVAQTLHGRQVESPPFPKDPNHPYYAEKPCRVIEALETNTPTYLDAINIVNHGCISNLPEDAIVDIPALVVGGQVRGIHVGELPLGPMEICRRQITLHEMIAQATHEGDESLVIQALCLDPYVRSITQARAIWADYKKAYRDYLPTFNK